MEEKQESVTNQVIKNYFWNFLMIFLGRIGGVIFIAIVARILLPEKYGIYALATSVAILTITFTNRGINQSLSKYLSESLGQKNKKQATAYYKYFFKFKLALTLISAIIFLILSYPLTYFIFRKPPLFWPLIISSIYMICISFQNFYEYVFYTIKKVKYLTLKEAILQISKITLVLILLTLFTKNQVSLTILALIISSLIVIFFLYANLKKEITFIFKSSKQKIDKKKVSNFTFNMVLSNISGVVFACTDIIIIGIFLTSEYSGYYSAAFALIGGLYGLIALAGILLPVFTQLKENQLSNAFNQVFKYLSMISIPIIFGTIILGKHILKAVYGESYLQATLPLIFLSILIFEFPITDSLKSLFYAKNMPKKVVKISISASILNVILNISFILIILSFSTQLWAMTGVAIATVLSRFFILFSLSVSARKKLNIRYKFKFILKPLIAGISMMLILLLINTQIVNITIWIGFFEIILGASIYLIIMLAIKGITREDLELIKSLKPKF